MNLPLRSTVPSVIGLVPATLVEGLGQGIEAARSALRLGDEQIHPTSDGSLTAELSVPQGKWRIWADRGRAAWLGRRHGDLPRVNGAVAVGLDLPSAIRHLHSHGMWCVEVRLLDEDGWSRPTDAYDGLSELMRRTSEISAVSGIFSDGESGPARVELHTDGRVLADSPSDAERWLLVVHNLDANY